MRLHEFLEYCVPAYKLKDVLYKNDDLVLNYYTEPAHNNSVSAVQFDKQTVIETLSRNYIKFLDFDNLLHKYGWYISYVNDNIVNVVKLNNYDYGNYDKESSFFNNLYFHISNVLPTKILSNGLIAKKSDISDSKNEISYPDKRVYLWKLEDISGNLSLDDKNFESRLLKTFSILLNGLNIEEYGNYVYLVKLSNSIKTHYDQEYGPENPARYVTQNIPPSAIKYVGTISKLSSIISNNDIISLEQIFKNLQKL